MLGVVVVVVVGYDAVVIYERKKIERDSLCRMVLGVVVVVAVLKKE